ncbi:hypothetical protein LPJ61_001004, partial [Coemansia biformis]
MDGNSDEELDLFGDATPDERASAAELRSRRCAEQRSILEQSRPAGGTNAQDQLAFQRRRYLQSDQHPRGALGFETLRSARPMNFGEVFTQPERQAILASVREFVQANQWTTQRHGAFPTRDVPVKAITAAGMVVKKLKTALFPLLQRHTGIDAGFWAFRDLFVVG